MHYLETWLIVDLIAVLPIGLIYCSLAGESMCPTPRADHMLMVLKMLRLFRASRLWSRWEERVEKWEIPFSTQSMLTLLMSTFYTTHWIACIWRWTGDISRKGDIGTYHSCPTAPTFIHTDHRHYRRHFPSVFHRNQAHNFTACHHRQAPDLRRRGCTVMTTTVHT